MLEATLGVPVSIQPTVDHLHSPEKRHIDGCRMNISEMSATAGVRERERTRERMRERKDRNCQSVQESVYMLFLALPKEAALFSEAYG